MTKNRFKSKGNATDERKIKRIERKNNRIARINAIRIEEVRESIDPYFANAKNSKGESVRFQFNYIEKQVDEPHKMDTREGIMLGRENALEGGAAFENGPNELAPATIVLNIDSNRSHGSGLVVEADEGIPGALAHEVGHQFMTRGQRGEESPPGSGGLMVDPPNSISRKEVDKMLEDAVERKK